MFGGVCRMVVAWAMVSASAVASAQPIPQGELPGRERERFVDQPGPRSRPGGATISLPGTVAPPGAENIAVVVKAVRVVGSTIYTTDQFAPLYADLIGQQTNLKAVYEIAQRITAKYGGDGYVLSRAIVPPQELSPGGATVRIEVVEGYVDKVEWPAVLSNYRDFFSYYAAMITAQRPANIRVIERYLLLAGDLPGLKFSNSLKPSARQKGAATLVVEVTEKPIDVLARVDNRGTRARGPLEYLGSASFNNLLHMHESLALTYAGTFKTRELQYFGGSWRQVLTPEGLSFFANASYGYGRPGTRELELLEYKTKSAYLESGLSVPFIRARERNLSATILGFGSDDKSDTLGVPFTRDRLRGIRGKLDMDAADILLGISQLSITVSHGFVGLGSTSNDNPLRSRFNGRVDFTKVEATASRLQPLPGNFSLLLAAYLQYAVTPLLSPELCGYGGRVFGRAFEPSQFTADSCVETVAEVRYDLPTAIKEITQAQLFGFYDHGWLHNLASVVGPSIEVDATSVGAGLRLGWMNTLSADLTVARGVQGLREPWRFFFIVTGKL